MKPRTVAILAIIGVLVAAGTWFASRSEARRSSQIEVRLDQAVFADFGVADVTAISIRPDSQRTVNLHRGAERWVVDDQDGYPADPTKVLVFIRNIAGLRPRLLTPHDGDLAPFNLLSPDAPESGGIQITLHGEGDRVLADLIIGMPYSPGNSGSSGNYMIRVGDDQVFVGGSPIANEDLDSVAWIDRTFLKVEDPRAMALTRGDKLEWAIRRASPSAQWSPDFQLPEDAGLDERRAAETADGLRWTAYAAILPADDEDADFSAPQVLRVETFSGPIYTLTIGGKRQKDGQYPLRIALEWPADAPTNPQVKERFDREQRVLPNWIYIVPAFTVERLICDRSRLLKKVHRLPPTNTAAGGGTTEEAADPADAGNTIPSIDDLTQPHQPIAGDDEDDGMQGD